MEVLFEVEFIVEFSQKNFFFSYILYLFSYILIFWDPSVFDKWPKRKESPWKAYDGSNKQLTLTQNTWVCVVFHLSYKMQPKTVMWINVNSKENIERRTQNQNHQCASWFETATQ